MTWTTRDAEALYAVESWADGFFFVNAAGHAAVRPFPERELAIDITAVLAEVARRGVQGPVLLRFQDVLRARVQRLNEAFRAAIAGAGYRNGYHSVYPIKVNQLHEVVEEVLDAGKAYALGLECGSKAELVAALPLVRDERLLLCNGVKDAQMLSLILSAQRLGQHVLPVVEKFSEFERLAALADANGQAPRLGVRVKLATRGSGRWFESSGGRSKFGLGIPDLMQLVRELERRGWRSRLELLHFHLGSQIADIQVLKSATKELSQIYADLHGRGVAPRFIDVGGGLGVHYGAAYGGEEASAINYSLQEYANAIVYTVKEVCEARGVPEPCLVSESGRAITAHHSMLAVPVLGAYAPDAPRGAPLPDKPHPLVKLLLRVQKELRGAHGEADALLEAYHDAREAKDEAESLLRLGYLDVEQAAAIDEQYWIACREILAGLRAAGLEDAPPEQLDLEAQLTDLYLANFSVFQSMLDHWAIGQVFPVMPLARLDERPARKAVVVDLTCDSDGKIAEYVTALDNPRFLPLHELRAGEPYHLGVFLMGAYQDIMGDAHN
ncbi:MAG TPA: biosynthetic arginine decarboxylase, partial [Burkholderiales bacterium]|nr:biosynthetic arginine decarboxylase [Burkholderiales bacterium]